MAGRPEEKYEPGELTRVKENLGKVSEEEAKRMSKVLGGEIGIEQTDQHIMDKYQELSSKIRDKDRGKWITQTIESSSRDKKVIKAIKYSYLEKIKLYYLAAQPNHSIKTTKQTIKAIFDLLSKQKNYINPNLIESSNYFFYKSIKNLVESVRIIKKNIPKKYIRREENPFYWIIIDTISDWEIESIKEEIVNLKCDSKHITLNLCSDLIKMIYFPIIRLSKVDQKKDIEGALRYIYKLSIAGLFKKDLKIDRLRKAYTQGLSETNNIFKIIKYRLYPLLLMSVSSKVYDYNTMFKLKGHEILNFLDLKTKDLITYFENKDKKNIVNDQEENDLIEEDLPIKDEILDLRTQQGIYFLNKMFPGAGWDKLSENPDMYPYFKNILNLPNDGALISPDDPLQRILILIALLKDMFYGFSNIEYGFLRNSDGKTIDLKEDLDQLIKNWYLYIDELILKQYLGSLNEYCRYLERGSDVSKTEYINRIASDILWIKKTYICPNIPIYLPRTVQQRSKIAIPKLFNSVDKLNIILSKMVQEIFSRGDMAIETIRNPQENSWFEIENHVSLRLKSLLKKENKKLTNGELIISSYKVVTILNLLIISSDQEKYEKGISWLFRSEESRGVKPIYSVSESNSFFRLKDKDPFISFKPLESTKIFDKLTGFLGKDQFFIYIDHYISIHTGTKFPFSIININILEFNSHTQEESIKELLNTEKIISESIHLLKDIPFRTEKDNFYIILPQSDTETSLKTAKRIFSNSNNQKRLYIGVCEYQDNMDPQQLLKHLENTISKQLPSPQITYYDIDKERYIQESL